MVAILIAKIIDCVRGLEYWLLGGGGVLGGVHKHFCHISKGGGVEIFFPAGLGRWGGEGRKFSCPSRENLTGPPPGNK